MMNTPSSIIIDQYIDFQLLKNGGRSSFTFFIYAISFIPNSSESYLMRTASSPTGGNA